LENLDDRNLSLLEFEEEMHQRKLRSGMYETEEEAQGAWEKRVASWQQVIQSTKVFKKAMVDVGKRLGLLESQVDKDAELQAWISHARAQAPVGEVQDG